MAEKHLGDSTPRGRGLRWHRELAQITGGLALAVGRGLSRATLRGWATTLERVAVEMRETSDGNTSGDT